MERNLTQGNVLKNLISFALPFLLSYFYKRYTGWLIFLSSVSSVKQTPPRRYLSEVRSCI